MDFFTNLVVVGIGRFGEWLDAAPDCGDMGRGISDVGRGEVVGVW